MAGKCHLEKKYNFVYQTKNLVNGKTYIGVDARNIYDTDENGDEEFRDSIPFAFIVKRENFMASDYNPDGSFKWVKYQRFVNKSIGLEKKKVRQIVIIDSFFTRIYEEKNQQSTFQMMKGFFSGGDWMLVSEIKNELGFVPFKELKLIKSGYPVTNTISKWQFKIMNFESSIHNKLIVQCLDHLVMSQDMAKRFKQATASSIITYEDGSTDKAYWIGPNASTLTQHFEYLKYAGQSIESHSHLKRKEGKDAESAEAKEIDWYDSESVLNFGNNAVEPGLEFIIKVFTIFADKNQTLNTAIAKAKYDRKYIKDSVQELLQQALSLDLIKIGETVNMKFIIEKVIPALDLELNEQEKQSAAQEILKLIQNSGMIEKNRPEEDITE